MKRIVDYGPVVNLWLILFSLGVNTPVRLLNHATFGESKTVIGVTEENKRTRTSSRVGKKTMKHESATSRKPEEGPTLCYTEDFQMRGH